MTHYKSLGYKECPKCENNTLIVIDSGTYDNHSTSDGNYHIECYKDWILYACLKCKNIIFDYSDKEKMCKTVIPENSSYWGVD